MYDITFFILNVSLTSNSQSQQYKTGKYLQIKLIIGNWVSTLFSNNVITCQRSR